MSGRIRFYFCGYQLAVLSLTLCVGCIPKQLGVISPTTSSTTIGTPSSRTIGATDGLPESDAPRPRPDSVGVVVGAPVVTAAASSRDSEAFANAIGWYLNDAVAGAPEFGQTPARWAVERAAKERMIAGLRWSRAEANRLALATGANRTVTGEMSETAHRIEVAYSIDLVQDATNGQTNSSATSFHFAVGSRTELLAKLPAFAERLRAALGAPHSAVTPPTLRGISSDMFRQLGACLDGMAPPPYQQRFLDTQGSSLPFVAEVAILQPKLVEDNSAAKPFAELLVKTEPRNAQVLWDLANNVPMASPSLAVHLYGVSDTYKANYALAHASNMSARAADDTPRADKYAARAATNAPANPDACLAKAGIISRKAEQIRQGRFDSDMDRATWDTLQPLYASRQEESEVATKCDPLYAKAWARVAESATFAGDYSTADTAMTKARQLTSLDPYDIYSWALEMYAPKWGSHRERLEEVANEAAQVNYLQAVDAVNILGKLSYLGFSEQKAGMEERLLQQCAATLKQAPKDQCALYLRGSLYEEMQTPAMGTHDFDTLAETYPNDSFIQRECGQHYVMVNRLVLAEAAFRRSVALSPDDVESLPCLGWILKRQGRFKEAVPILLHCLRLKPDSAVALSTLGTVYAEQKQLTAAIPLYIHALRIDPFQREANINLANCYADTGRDDEGISLLERMRKYYPPNPELLGLLGELYVHTSQWPKAEEVTRDGIKLQPDNISCHAYLGDALAGQGAIEQARTEWQQAITIDPKNDDAVHAKEQLIKHAAG